MKSANGKTKNTTRVATYGLARNAEEKNIPNCTFVQTRLIITSLGATLPYSCSGTAGLECIIFYNAHIPCAHPRSPVSRHAFALGQKPYPFLQSHMGWFFIRLLDFFTVKTETSNGKFCKLFLGRHHHLDRLGRARGDVEGLVRVHTNHGVHVRLGKLGLLVGPVAPQLKVEPARREQ